MLDVLLYFTLNFAGFLVFLWIWNRLPKPKPFDYTTIPGLKLNIDDPDQLPDLVVQPGTQLDDNLIGHHKEIKKFTTIQHFLQFLVFTYGPLNSFWWSNRYVVTVSSESFIAELKKFRANLVAVSPFSIGSYLQGDSKYCTSVEYDTVSISRVGDISPDITLEEDEQNTIFVNCKVSQELNDNGYCDTTQIMKNLRQVEHIYRKNDKDTLRQRLSRPLMVVFDEEIWIDAHPIPKYIPIIINTESIISNWLDDELFPKFYAIFYWVPGFHNLNDIL